MKSRRNPDGFFRGRVPLPGNLSRSSNDVVEHPLPERPVEQARHAIPPREPPLRDEASFYAPVEPSSAQHHLRKEVILGRASTGPQGSLPGAARTGDNFLLLVCSTLQPSPARQTMCKMVCRSRRVESLLTAHIPFAKQVCAKHLLYTHLRTSIPLQII